MSNREIKFRIWDSKIMRTDFSIGANGVQHGDLEYVDDFGDKTVGILMQFTGLKDKNGVEIYEGDIVDARTDGVWQDACRNGSNLVVVEWLPIGYYRGFLGYTKGEVIGNIHEHPELLESD